ncbi:hypothetical protein DY000_02056105 [Brassica cretica]|uniref:Uncharacterized protein n=1 Tax=Brassica cretica TaxID=69181 RepID=A0ABQ7A9Y5_BRACR|nr:hypothetical protein DY000_02056105 [Brassica cretica]
MDLPSPVTGELRRSCERDSSLDSSLFLVCGAGYTGSDVVRSLCLVLVAIWSSSWSTSKASRHESSTASKCIVSANFGSVRGCTVEAIRGRRLRYLWLPGFGLVLRLGLKRHGSVGEASMLRSCVVPYSATYGFSGLLREGLRNICSIAAGF